MTAGQAGQAGQPGQARQAGQVWQAGAGTVTVAPLRSVRAGRPSTVALAGSRCWVADALARCLTQAGDRVVRLDRDDEAASAWDDAGCGADVVVHLAGGPREPSLRGRSEPALETLAALHTARADGARLVIASLPGNAARLPADEALAEGFRTAHHVETVVVEVAECYGPGMPGGRAGVLGRMLDQALTDGVVVVEAGDDREHPVCFVDDAVAGLVAVVRGCPAGRFRVSPPTAARTLDLARAVAEATGAVCRVRDRRRLRVAAPTVPPQAADRPRPPEPSLPEGWLPRVDLPTGLARCLAGRPDVAAAASATPGLPARVLDLREPLVAVGDDVA